MRSCEGFVLVFDLTEKRSLEMLVEFIDDIKRTKDTEIFPAILCGNKSDLVSKHAPDILEHAESFRRQYLNNCPFFETSAKDRTNIDETFHALVRAVRSADPNEVSSNNSKKKTGLFSSVSSTEDAKSDLAQFKSL
jgi:GTPase SAR1 family protein